MNEIDGFGDDYHKHFSVKKIMNSNDSLFIQSTIKFIDAHKCTGDTNKKINLSQKESGANQYFRNVDFNKQKKIDQEQNELSLLGKVGKNRFGINIRNSQLKQLKENMFDKDTSSPTLLNEDANKKTNIIAHKCVGYDRTTSGPSELSLIGKDRIEKNIGDIGDIKELMLMDYKNNTRKVKRGKIKRTAPI